MVYLIGSEEAAPVGVFGRWHRSISGGEGYRVVDTVVLGTRMRRMTVENPSGPGSGLLRRNIARAAAQLRLERTGRVIFSDDFRNKEQFVREGFDEMNSDAH